MRYGEKLGSGVCISVPKVALFGPICGTKVGLSNHLNRFQAPNHESEVAVCPIDNRTLSIGNSRVPFPVSRLPSPVLRLDARRKRELK